VDAYLQRALQDPAVDAATKREILSTFSRCHHVIGDCSCISSVWLTAAPLFHCCGEIHTTVAPSALLLLWSCVPDAFSLLSTAVAMSQDLIGKPSVAPLDTTGAVSMEPLISARTSLSLLRGAGSNPTAGGAPVLSTPGVSGAAASRAAARSMSPNGRARGE
jgi:hypothetical protein